MTKQVHDAFQDILEAIAAGRSIESALESYPQFADELRPLLESAPIAAPEVLAVEIDATARERSRTHMLKYAAQRRAESPSRMPQWRFSFASLLIAAILLLSSTGIWVASAQSLPGDPFYAIKRTAEDINRSLVSDKNTLYDLDFEYRQRRVNEVLRLLATDRVETVTFSGVLLEQNKGLWSVERVPVIIHDGTLQYGPFTPGDEVEVQGVTTKSNAVLASAVTLRRYHLIGPVLSQSELSWVIAGRYLDVSDAIIEDGIEIGSIVDAEVRIDDGGLHQAIRIALMPILAESPTAEPAPSSNGEDFDQKQRFEGQLESMSASAIIVDGQIILIDRETEIEGVLTPGSFVRVEASQTADGSWIALEIKVDGDEGEDDGSDSEVEEPSDDEPDGSEEPDKDETDEDKSDKEGGEHDESDTEKDDD